MNKREEIKEKYKSGDDFVSDISKRTMLIYDDLNAFLNGGWDNSFDNISVNDYFTLFSLRDKLKDLIHEHVE